MKEMSVEQLIQSFIENKSLDRIRRNLFQFIGDNKLIEKSEKHFGVAFYKMNYDQLLYVIETICKAKSKSEYAVSYDIYNINYNMLRRLLVYYSQNVCPIVNPLLEQKVPAAYLIYLKNQKRFCKEEFDKIIDNLHANLKNDNADYYELVVRLFYHGFQDFQEIINFKKQDLNTETLVASVNGRSIKLSERCYELLNRFQMLSTLDEQAKYTLASWHGSYFKCYVFRSAEAALQNRPDNQVANAISRRYSVFAKYDLCNGLSCATYSWLGLYDCGVEKYGEEEFTAMLLSPKDEGENALIKQLAEEAGYSFRGNISRAKLLLREFIDRDYIQ